MSKRLGMDDGPFYAAYLLRVWRIKSAGATHWRVIVIDPQTGAEQRLGSLEALLPFLRSSSQRPPGPGPSHGDAD